MSGERLAVWAPHNCWLKSRNKMSCVIKTRGGGCQNSGGGCSTAVLNSLDKQ